MKFAARGSGSEVLHSRQREGSRVLGLPVLGLRLAGLLGVATLCACPPKPAAQAPDAGAATGTSTSAAIELPPGDGPVATVNGIAIARDPFNKEFKLTIERYQRAKHEVQPALRERLKDNIVRRLVDAELIRQQAEKMQVVVTEAERNEAWEAHKKRYGTEEAFKTFLERSGTTAEDIRSQFDSNLLRERVFAKVSEESKLDPKEIREFFDKNAARYDEPEQVQASHILLRFAPTATPEEKAEKKKKADEVLKKAKAKGADFAALAKEFGEDPTKDRGGDLGLFTKGRMVKQFEDAVWSLKAGQLSGVVETQFGFHIIKKIDHKKARKKKFEEVSDQIEKQLIAKKKNEAIRDALAKWKNESKIDIIVKGDEAIMATGASIPRPNMVDKHPGAANMNIKRVEMPSTNDTPTGAAGTDPHPGH